MAALVLIHALLFLLFWSTNLIFRQAVNRFLGDLTGLQADYLFWFMLFTTLMGFWSAGRLIVKKDRPRPGPDWRFRAAGGFYLTFFYVSFLVLFIKNPIQLIRLGQMIGYFRLFLDVLLLGLALWGWVLVSKRGGQRWKKIALPGACLVLWLAPLFWPPGLVYRGALPPRPLLMAHRGASAIAPENTLAAMQIAANLGVYGLESDIQLSADGVLFLMHDETLARTTDVAQIFPGRADEPAETFTWAELSQLDAGAWFQGETSPLSFEGQPIPALSEVLRLVGQEHLHFVADVRVSDDHPFAGQALELYLGAIRTAGVAPDTWILAAPEEIALIRAALPEAALARGLDWYTPPPAPEELVAAGYRVVNSEYSLPVKMIRLYRQAGLWVNLWTVDERWQYSRLWLAGADSVTTNRAHDFIHLSRPVMALPYALYGLIWGIAAALAVGLVFFFGRHA